MDAYVKVRLKLFALNVLFELIVNAIILSVAYLVDKLLITILFYLPFHCLRYAFPKVFHARGSKPIVNLANCIMLSCICYFTAIKLMLPINISIFSSVMVAILINHTLFKIQDYLDLKKKNTTDLFKLCKMSDDELRAYAISKYISESLVDTLVLRLKYNYRWCDIQAERALSKDAIRYHRDTLRKILGVKI